MLKFNGKLTPNNEFKHDITKYIIKNNLINNNKIQLLSTHEKKFISNDDTEQLWSETSTSEFFDENIFRLDILGNLIVKNISYNNSNIEQKKLAYNLEQVKNTNEICFVNTGVISILDIHLKCHLGSIKLLHNVNLLREPILYDYIIQDSHLLYDLKTNLHNTCIQYNLLFVKNINNKWSLQKSEDTLYKIYSNEYIKTNTPLIIDENINNTSFFNKITNIASNLYNNTSPVVGDILKIVALSGVILLLQNNNDEDDD